MPTGEDMSIDDWRVRYEELDRDAARLRAEWDAALKENSQLRLVLATSNAQCAYCGLPAEEMAKCASGFPGCARGDDMLSDNTPTRRELVAERDAAQAEAARAVEALRKLSERVAISAKDSFGTCDEWLDSFRLNFPDECAAYEEAVAVLSASEPALDWLARVKREAARELRIVKHGEARKTT